MTWRKVDDGKLCWRSSNYSLYQDMMRRITAIVGEMWQEIEIYSIDESFGDLSKFKIQDLEVMAVILREKILKYTGIPVCIGIGETKTLAKVGDRIAKKYFKDPGVCVIDDEGRGKFALQNLLIEDVRDRPPRCIKAYQDRINTAYDFSCINEYGYIEKRFTVTEVRTWYELRGNRHACKWNTSHLTKRE